MPWFKVDDKLHSHRKAARAGEALALWVVAGSWCMDHLTDGFVPEYMAPRLMANGASHAETLASCDLWEPGEKGGEKGWFFHDWPVHQPTREAIEEDRRKARERMSKLRNGSGDVRANNGRSSGVVHDSHTHTHTHTNNKTETDDASFDAFWSAYPKKVGKGQAVKAWRSAAKKADTDAIMAGLAAANASWKAAGTDQKFIPNPATWLNGERWDDEVPAAAEEDDPWSHLPTAEELVARRGF